jgi:hypothetical protein
MRWVKATNRALGGSAESLPEWAKRVLENEATDE